MRFNRVMSRRHRIDDATAEAVLAGRVPPGGDDLAGLATAFNQAREAAAHQAAPVMAEALREASAAVVHDPDHAPAVPEAWVSPRRTRMKPVTALGAALGTITGKIVLGTAVAAASVGGLHAADVVDIPGLPGDAHSEAESNHPGTEIDVPTDEAGAHDDAQVGSQPEGTGVDGDSVSDRATSGEPQADGQGFGESVADEATPDTVPPTGGQVSTADAPADETTGDAYSSQVPEDAPPADESTGDEYAGEGQDANPTGYGQP